MSVSQVQTREPAVQDNLAFLQFLLGDYHPRDFAVRFWDGSVWEPDPGQPARFTLVLRHPGSVRAMFWPPRGLTLGEAYIFDDFDVEGDIDLLWLVLKHVKEGRKWTLMDKFRFALRVRRLPGERRPRVGGPRRAQLRGEAHSKERDREAVTFHYDVSPEFYALFQDSRMVYSCAYFGTPDDSLDTAQEQKLDYLCRKLRLRPGERLLDIGCGWGALALHAAKNYGVEVLGVTLSRPQMEVANERIRQAGLANRARVEIRDWRETSGRETYDKIVSIEMFEHVGAKNLPACFRKVWELLRPGGLMLHQASHLGPTTKEPPGPTFIKTYVFPDGELVRINDTLRTAEDAGFEVRDVESLREHFALTLRHWVRRLEERADEARRLTDDVVYRIWRLYMAMSNLGFRLGRINLYQALFAKPQPNGDCGLPLTRANWYA